MSNLLAQRKEIKRLEKVMESKESEIAEEEARLEEQARKRGVEEFERVQMGLSAQHKRTSDAGSQSAVNGSGRSGSAGKPIKRKFEIDEEELLRIAQGDRAKARRAIAEERDGKKRLPSFWVASETPDAGAMGMAKPRKLQPLCPCSDENKPHQYSLKTLTTVHFSEQKDSGSGDPVRSCPACRKALSNATKATLAVPCGHVLCKPCVSKFMTPHDKGDAHDPDAEFGVVRCYVCDAALSGTPKVPEDEEKSGGKKEKNKSVKPGLVEIKSDGTGFAGGGKNMARKEGVAFQC